MRTLRLMGLVFLCIAASLAKPQTGHITAAEAKNHIGERATICGNVVSTHYAARSNPPVASHAWEFAEQGNAPPLVLRSWCSPRGLAARPRLDFVRRNIRQ